MMATLRSVVAEKEISINDDKEVERIAA